MKSIAILYFRSSTLSSNLNRWKPRGRVESVATTVSCTSRVEPILEWPVTEDLQCIEVSQALYPNIRHVNCLNDPANNFVSVALAVRKVLSRTSRRSRSVLPLPPSKSVSLNGKRLYKVQAIRRYPYRPYLCAIWHAGRR